jgi:RNA polymerase sigma-70 factor (ECF subfamily)
MDKIITGYHKTPIEIEQEIVLIEKAKINPEEFKPLYEAYYNLIFGYVFKRVLDEYDAAEITSDVFTKALLNIKKYKSKGYPFGAWLYSIARNEVINFIRKNKKEKIIKVSDEEFMFLLNNTAEKSNKNEFEKEKNLNRVLKSLSYLNDDELELIELRFFENLSFDEIGKILKIKEATARVKCHRIILKLKKLINKKI